MGFFAVVDYVVAVEGVFAAVESNASGVGGRIDSNNRRKLTAAHNETLNSHRETLNNNAEELNDVHRHCDVCYLREVLRNTARILMSSVVNNQGARVNDFPFVFFAGALDIRRKARYSGVEGLESSTERGNDLIQLNVELIGHNICLDRKREQANNFHNYFAALMLI